MPIPSHIPDYSGLWASSYFIADISAKIRQDRRTIRGVVAVNMPGEKNTYHIKGRVNVDGTIEAWHHSGHRFLGAFTEEDRVEGVLTTKKGTDLNLCGKRVSRTVPSKPL